MRGADEIIPVDRNSRVSLKRCCSRLIWEEIVGRIGEHAGAVFGSLSIYLFVDILIFDILLIFLLHLGVLLLGAQLLVVNLRVRPLWIEPNSLLEVLFVYGLALSIQRILINIMILSTQIFVSESDISVTVLKREIVIGGHRQQVFSLLCATPGPSDI